MQIEYSPHLEEALIEDLEAAAGRVGLPLERLELIGQDEDIARSFIEAVECGMHETFLEIVSWDRLEDTLEQRRRAVRAAIEDLARKRGDVAKPRLDR